MSGRHHKKAAFGPSGGGRVYARDSNPRSTHEALPGYPTLPKGDELTPVIVCVAIVVVIVMVLIVALAGGGDAW